MVRVPGGGADFQGVHVGIYGSGAPAGVFFSVVAGFAKSCPVAEVCLPAGVPRNHMVYMPDGRIAIWRPAAIVTGLDEAPEAAAKKPGFGVGGKEFSGSRRGIEPAKPDRELPVPG
ncbi:hypothetical protein D3C73_1365660 [compost metagenome]